jgi:nucleotide-binding universal stress UspA family protein
MGHTPRNAVVVGCDGSYESEQAVVSAAREAERRRTRLALLVILSDRDLAAERLSDVAHRERQARAHAAAVLRRAEDRVATVAPALAVDEAVGTIGSHVVAQLAERACLLVLGRHGRGGQRAMSLGSVSEDLAKAFRVPIYIPRDMGSTGVASLAKPKVVVGVDGRGGEEELLSVAADEARSRGAGLVIVRAVQPGGTEDRLARPHVWDETWMAVHHAEQTADVSSRVVVSVDEPVRALLVECGSEDLLVVGTRGGGRLAGLVRGSVARGVIDAGLCDVVVVPPGAHVDRRSEEVGSNAGA